MTSGTWGISNNQLAQTDPISSGVPTVRSASALAQADYQISSQLTPLTGGGYVGLAARYVDANNHYFLRLRVDTNNVSLYRVQGGTFSLLGSAPAPSPALALGQTYHLRLTVQGSTITGEFSRTGTIWTPVATATDTVFTAAGFIAYRTAYGTTLRADTLRVVSVGAPADTTPPDTTIASGPTGTITVNTATFTFSGTDNVTPTASLVYATRLSPVQSSFSAFGAATTATYTALANGSYTVEVKAKDAAGNEDATPASRSFTVEVVAPPPPGSLVYDPFTRADNATNPGPLWTVLNGTWGISAQQLIQSNTTNAAYALRSASLLPQANYQLQSQLTPLTGAGYIGLFARMSDENNNYFLRLRVDTNNVSLYRVQGGTFSLLGSAPAPSPALALGQTYHLRLTVQGSTITGEFSRTGTIWTPVATATDTVFSTPGYVGYRTSNGTARADECLVLGLGAPADTTPPTTPVVTDDGASTTSTTQLHATWTSSDPESGVVEYQYQIRQDSTTGTILRNWTSTGTTPSVTATGLTLTLGKTYFIGVQAKNGAGLWSSAGFSNGILIVSGTGTTVGGNITANTTWTLAGSPYTVTSTVTVYNNATLTIQPGVVVKFNANMNLVLGSGSAGILNAQGTVADPILFTTSNAAPAPGQWLGIRFLITTPASIMNRCVVEYGGQVSLNSNIEINSSTPTISNSTIRKSQKWGLYVAYGGGAKPIITNNIFDTNGSYPLHLELANLPTSLSGNTYQGNAIQAIELNGAATSGNPVDWTIVNDGLPYVMQSSIYMNIYYYFGTYKLTIQPGVTLKFPANTGVIIGSGSSSYPGILVAQGTPNQPITFTSANATPAPGQWGGIQITGTTNASILDYCTIEYGGDGGGTNANLSMYYSPMPSVHHSVIRNSSGAGIRLYNARTIIEQNTITGNAQGILITDTQSREEIRHNAIVGNSLGGIVNASTGIAAPLNWWGSALGPSGGGPGDGDAISGPVAFEPWLGQAPSEPFKWVDAQDAPDPFTQAGGLHTFFGSLPEAAAWAVTIKNAAGTIVKTLTGTGTSLAQDWNGTNTANAMLPNGIYSFQMTATSTVGSKVASPANGLVTLNNALPIANITSPRPGQVLPAGAVNILGTAAGTTFASYVLDYGTGYVPTSWSTITSTTTSPITNSLLGTWNADRINPPFTLRLTVTSTTGQTSTESVVVQTLALSGLFDTPDPFSPNGDGVQDTTTINASVSLPSTWAIMVKNGGGTVVRTLTGSGQTIAQAWDGKDASGVRVPDGAYSYQIQATEPASGVSITSTSGQVTVDATLPTALIAAPTQNQTFLTDAAITLTGTASDTNFSNFTLAYGVGSVPASFTTLTTQYSAVVNGALYTVPIQGWAPGTYIFRLTVTDDAGNVSTLNRQIVLDHIQVSNVSAAPRVIDPYTSEKAGITYRLSRAANTTIKIYDDRSKQPVRTLTASGQAAGVNTLQWDGKNGSGMVAPLEAYYFTIEAVDPANAGRKGTYNNATAPISGPTPTTENLVVSSANFNPHRNDLLPITYDLTNPGRLKIEIVDGNDSRIIFRTLRDNQPIAAGSRTEYWDGWAADGSIHPAQVSVYFDVPVALPALPIILARAPMDLSNFRAEAYVIQPAFHEVSTLTYTLSKAATVTVTITDPNGNSIKTLIANSAQAAGPQSLEWDGRTAVGTLVSLEGDYKVTLTAVDPVSGQASTRLGTIVVYK